VLSNCASAWYAIRVKSNRERITSQGLEGKGFEVCLPRYSANGGDETHSKAEVPLFPGYVFSRFDPHQRLPILTIPGVVHIVSFGGIPQPVEESEMIALLDILKSGLPVIPYPMLPVGEAVRLKAGPLAGLCGVILSHKQEARFVVSVTLLQRSVAVEVDRSWVGPVRATPERRVAV
jgi:transcription antitermination factor NusG